MEWVLFLGLGENTDSSITFTNGSIVNGVGLADGTGFWDLKEEERGNIAGGGNVNLGWNTFSSENDIFVLNLEGGSKFSAWSLEFANAGACQSSVGSIIWNQQGTDMENGYTEAVFIGDINLRMGTVYFDQSSFNTELNLLGYTSLYSNSNLNIGNNEAASGSATFFVSGENNTVDISSVYFNSGNNTEKSTGVANFNIDENASNSTINIRDKWESFVGVGATHNINISGQNNTMYVTNDFNLTNKTLVDGNTVWFTMTGEGNTLSVNNFKTSNDSTQDESLGGFISASFKGSNADNKNHLVIRSGEMILQGSQALDSTTSISYSFQGNTTLTRGDGRGVWLKVNEWGGKQYTSDVTFEVMGSGNEILLSGLEVGKDTDNWDESAGKGIFRIVGGGSSIVIKNSDGDNHNGFKLNSGGMIEFVVDDTGITPITNLTWNNNTSNGMITVDLSNITTPQDEARYVLFQTSDPNPTVFGELFDVSNPEDVYAYEEFVSVLLASDEDSYRFALEYNESEEFQDAEGNNINFMQLVVYYTNNIVVPEPSTYAAIFGAIALAFAAYRRRK